MSLQFGGGHYAEGAGSTAGMEVPVYLAVKLPVWEGGQLRNTEACAILTALGVAVQVAKDTYICLQEKM